MKEGGEEEVDVVRQLQDQRRKVASVFLELKVWRKTSNCFHTSLSLGF